MKCKWTCQFEGALRHTFFTSTEENVHYSKCDLQQFGTAGDVKVWINKKKREWDNKVVKVRKKSMKMEEEDQL